MQTVKVLIYVESRYKADRKRIKRVIQDVLVEIGIKSAVEVSIAIVGDRKMRALNSKHRGKDTTTNVLSFPLQEVIRDASRDDVLVDDKIEELVRHGMQHLLGVHH